MEKLLQELEVALEITKDYNKFVHLFSDDDSVKTIAKLRKTLTKIRFKAKISKLKKTSHPEGKPLKTNFDTGSFVKVSPCAKEFEGKTFLGILIGHAALSSQISIKEDEIVCSWAQFNPAILIPDISKIVYGIESWWGIIESEADFKEITDLDIDNVWYVKALKQMNKE